MDSQLVAKALNDALKMLERGDEADKVVDILLYNLKSFKRLEKHDKKNVDTSKYPEGEYVVVDVGCRKNPGPTEYRGILMPSRKEYFSVLPFDGTNNLGEFLAIVHAMAQMGKDGIDLPIYSDSAIAINWVNKKICKTNWEKYGLEHSKPLADRAIRWLNTHSYKSPLKWQTHDWGEIPADYGRK